MGFHVADAARVDLRMVQRHANSARLTGHTGGGKAGFVSAIIVHAYAAYDTIDGASILQRVLQTFENHHPASAGKYGATGVSVKRSAMPVCRFHAAFHMQVATFLRYQHTRATGQRHITLATG